MNRNEPIGHLLELNFLEALLSFTEGSMDLSTILLMNERIYARPTDSIPSTLHAAVARLHELKVKMDSGRNVDADVIAGAIDEAIQLMSSWH